jgi:rhodanese-related sulfurtransferase
MNEYIAPRELREALQAALAPTIVDVRDADEYAAGHLPGARHIPGDQLRERLGELPRGRPVVTY